MTAEPTAREIARRIAYDWGADGVKHHLTMAIESALLAYSRRERAAGMREAHHIAATHPLKTASGHSLTVSGMRTFIRDAIYERAKELMSEPEHRARETEEGKLQPKEKDDE